MDCRKSLLVLAVFTLGSSGCLWNNAQKNGSADAPKTPEPTPDHVVYKKEKDGPKRQPSANLLTKLAVLREGQAEKSKEPDVQTRLYDDARRNYQEALKVDPNHLEALQGLGRIYIKLGDYEHAVDAYNKAIAKNPRSGSLWIDLAMCHNRKKDYPQAIKCMSKALEYDPENRAYMKTMGFTLARAGQVEQAMPYLTRALGEVGAHYNLARMLLHMNQVEQGRQHLALALRANPEHEPSRQLLAKLDQPNGAAPVAVELDGPGQ